MATQHPTAPRQQGADFTCPRQKHGERCYVCTLPIWFGDRVYGATDPDGLDWLIHFACIDQMPAIVGATR